MSRLKIARETWRLCKREPRSYRLRALVISVSLPRSLRSRAPVVDVITGYNIREGSQILAARRAERERCLEVADALIRRWKIQWLAREALRLLDEAA